MGGSFWLGSGGVNGRVEWSAGMNSVSAMFELSSLIAVGSQHLLQATH